MFLHANFVNKSSERRCATWSKDVYKQRKFLFLTLSQNWVNPQAAGSTVPRAYIKNFFKKYSFASILSVQWGEQTRKYFPIRSQSARNFRIMRLGRVKIRFTNQKQIKFIGVKIPPGLIYPEAQFRPETFSKYFQYYGDFSVQMIDQRIDI